MMKWLALFLTLFISTYCFTQVIYTFESGNLNGWTQVPDAHWTASSTTPLNGGFSLKHSVGASSATDKISMALPMWNPSNGTLTWQVKVRHGYDPSGSNRWWIYLMTDKDANQMQLGGTCSGYAIGVNLIGSDDILKLWKIVNGTPQVILVSTLNWQTQITTSGIGALEIERSKSGNFTLRASTSGSFSSLTNYGNIIDNSYNDFSYFGVCYNCTSSGDLKFWVDDISISYNLNDITTEVLNPLAQIAAGNIGSTSNTSVSAIDVLKFNIKDNATSDILPTKVKTLDIKKSASTNAANWVNSIGGFTVRGESGEVSITNQIIGADKVTLTVDSTTMTIPDGQTKEFTLSLYLKSNNMVDGATFRFLIDSANHGFDAGLSGSDFVSNFASKIYSNEFKIDVIATDLTVVQHPLGISKNTPFSLAIGGADISGNVDKEFYSDISLSLSHGEGVLTSATSLIKTPAIGVSSWSDLQYTTSGSLKILATSVGMIPVVTNNIPVLNDSTSLVSSGLSQPSPIGISSLITFPAVATEILRFQINDLGETDGLPTIVKSIKVSRAEITDAASLSKSIGGILVKVNGHPIGISEPDIKTNYFTFTASENSLVAPNGGFIDVSIYVYLNETGLIDNQKIQLKVDATNHGFTVYPTGSKFNPTFPLQVISNIFWIDVAASEQKFASIPLRVGVLQPFSVTLNAVDANGNTDKDFSGSENLSLLTGTGILAIPSGSTQPIVNGSCTFNSITYSKSEKFSLLASCTTLNNIPSSIITCGDSDGGIIAANASTNPISISSLSTSPQTAVEVMKIKVFDGGSSDGMPLIPSKIGLFCFDPTKAQQLYNQIGGFAIKADNLDFKIVSYNLTDGVFEIIPELGSLIIADKDTMDLSIYLYLKKNSIEDNFLFKFYVPSANHGWMSSTTGTGFASPFGATVYGPDCSMKVEATKLKIEQVPFAVVPSQQFTVEVGAADYYGNVDLDYSNSTTLSLENGTGTMFCSNPEQNITNGYAKWSDVYLNKFGTYRFKASESTLGNVTSDELNCGIERICLVQENFEGAINPSWLGANNWMLSTISPINGFKSLQHKPNSNAETNILSIPVNFPIMGDKLTEWILSIKNGNWDPSSDNYFHFALMASRSDLNSDGFFVGIDPTFSTDNLVLWRSHQGIKTPIITSAFDWNANDEIKIKVGLTPSGAWKLWYQPKSKQSYIFAGEGKYFSSYSMAWSGLVFGFTSSRSGQLWMDDLSICTTDYPPILHSAVPLNLNTIKVLFSEKINLTDASLKTNYYLQDKDGSSINIASIMATTELSNGVFLKTDRLPLGRLLLKVDNIGNQNGISLKDSIYFGLSEVGSLGRLIINEIMANPEPTVSLPSLEYIELFNPTSDTIYLNGWKIQMNDYKINLPSDSIMPNQYTVLCSTSSAPIMSTYGKSVGFTSFPSLLNSGMNIRLTDPNGALISMVNYSESWYGNELKKEGGYSLEKIDYQNLMEGRNNWGASNDNKGGTPCAANSIAKNNPDNTAPRLITAEVLTDKTIKLQFSEPMDSLMVTYANNFELDNGLGYPESSMLIGTEYNTVIISFNTSLETGVIYSLCLNQSITDFSGNQIINNCFPIALPQLPTWNDLVINEVLFNPNAGGVDFVELYNRSEKTIDLSKISIANRNSSTNQLEQIYAASDTAWYLFPNNYAVITVSSSMVKQFYHIENDKAFVNVSKLASFNNDKGNVVLLNNNLEKIDELSYTEKMHSKLLNDFKGVSLERINPNLSSSSASTWQSAAQTSGFATPTYKNSQWVEPFAKEDEFTLSPETFSPDGDGRDDYLLITYNLPIEGCITNIRVFSANGIEVNRLATNLLIGTMGTLSWDGFDKNNRKLPSGIYIVYIEYYNPSGEVKKYKKTCVVAEKF